MKKFPRITETEWQVMRVIWEKHPETAAEIIKQLSEQDSKWHPKTVRTLLARLVEKGALGYETMGRSYVYEPLVNEKEAIAEASDSFFDRVLGSSLKPMLAHFVEQDRLSKTEVEELRTLLNEAAAKSTSGSKRKGKKS